MVLILWLFASAPGLAGEVYCYSAGLAKAWDCAHSGEETAPLGRVYHTLKVTLAKGQDDTDLDRILPIERVGEVPLPSGERVLFLGRFRDSMKAFRVVQKCREVHAAECGRYAPKVVKIGLDDDDVDPAGEVRVAALDLQTKAAGDLVMARMAPLDLSEDVLGEAIRESIGSLRPKGLIKLPESLDYVLWADLKQGNLHVVRHDQGRLQLAETISISIGKQGFGKQQRGDKKTPVGVYRLLARLDDSQLDDFYGNGAYTLNYPNYLDQLRDRSGSGIWLHGLPKGKDHRPLQDSDGCVVLSNTVLDGIGQYVDLQNTPIVLDDQLEWVDGDTAARERLELEETIDSWRRAWSAIDNDRYLAFYADDFTNLEKDLSAWKRYKRRIHASKRYIKVTLSDLSLLAYPGEANTVLARFYQRYESDNFKARGWKEQLWRKEDSGEWRIVFERG
jgi:murein L,D-transpeptidase YafK